MAARTNRSVPPKGTDPVHEVLEAVARTVADAAPDLRIERKWGAPWRAGTDLVLCFAPFSQHVGIEFWRGTSLPDPEGLLEGTGKNLRHVKVRSIVEARAPGLTRLIWAAVELDRHEPKRTR
jgi:hypothetical protein